MNTSGMNSLAARHSWTAAAGRSHTGHVWISGDVCVCTGDTSVLRRVCIFRKELLGRDLAKIPAPLWRQFVKVICFSPLFVFKEKVEVKAPVCSWHSKGWHDLVPLWPGVAAQHSVPRSRNIQLLQLFNSCFCTGMATCQLLGGMCWISGVFLAAAEFPGVSDLLFIPISCKQQNCKSSAE